MPSLKEIRRRIHSIENIKKITKSMEMIAVLRFHRVQVKAEYAKKYRNALKQILSHLVALDIDKSHPLLSKGKSGPEALIVCSADRGLCGSYNTILFSAVDQFLKKYSKENIQLILFGRKAIDYYTRRNWTIAKKIPGWQEKEDLKIIAETADELVGKFLAGDFSCLHMMYTEHYTIFKRQVVCLPFLPLNQSLGDETFRKKDYIFEPSTGELFNELIPRFLTAELNHMFNQVYASELAARILAMRTAAKNAEDVKEKLVLERNKVRQATITKEVLEITTAAEAQ